MRFRFCGWPEALIIAGLLVTTHACTRYESRIQPNLVMITIDTLRADHVGAYGYFRNTTPNIDRLAAESLLCKHTVAPMATTLPSHVSMLTGTYPVRHGIVSNFRFILHRWRPENGLQSIAQMLKTAGYDTAAFTSSSPLCAETGIVAGFETFVGPPVISVKQGRIDRPAEQTMNHAIAWLEEAQEPFFLWVHLFDPHDPYSPPPPFDQAFAAGPDLNAHLETLGLPISKATIELFNSYDGEVLYADSEVGRLLSTLKATAVDDRSVLVLAGDHGEGLGQHDQPRHGGIWNEQLLVPLLIRLPGGPVGHRQGPASLIDIPSTLAAQTNLPLDPAQFDGIDLIRNERRSVLAQHEVRKNAHQQQWTLTEGRWKYWYNEAGASRLYDVINDPYELHDLIGQYPKRAEHLQSVLRGILSANAAKAATPDNSEVPEVLRRQLELLGYVQ